MATIDNVKPQYNPIRHYRGDVFDEVWTITQSDGTAYDLSGKSLLFKIKRDRQNNSALYTLTESDGITVSGANNNILTFNKVIDMNPSLYFYDLQITTDNYTISYGTWHEINDTAR